MLTCICATYTLTVQMPTCRYVGNRFLKRKVVHHHTSEQSVEWLYAFDVHCNSFVPMFMLLYGAHQLCTRTYRQLTR